MRKNIEPTELDPRSAVFAIPGIAVISAKTVQVLSTASIPCTQIGIEKLVRFVSMQRATNGLD